MSLILQLLARYWYVPIAMAVAGAGVHIMDSASYDHLETSFASYRAQVAEAESAAQKRAREALQAQIDTHHQSEVRNAQIIDDLTKRADTAAADAALSHRLLTALRTPQPGSARSAVPKAGDRPSIAEASRAPSGTGIETILTAAIGECERNADRLDALIHELQPQL